jgi:hypothetical protein
VRGELTTIAVGALFCAPAAAETRNWVPTDAAVAARLVDVGTWEFVATRRGPDGKTECQESWAFNADGTGLIVSGRQRVANKWWVKRDAGIGQWVFITDTATSEGPDCLGRPVEKAEFSDGRGHAGFQLLFYGDGAGALVCFEGRDVVRADGSRFNALDPEDCWGRIVPAAGTDEGDEGDDE